MFISWDDKKNESNYRKHQIWFEEAQSVVLNPLAFLAPNSHGMGERFEYLGYSSNHRILYVITSEMEERDIRIISARKASFNEREKYEEGI